MVRERIKILYFEASSGYGGSASSLANLITNLDRQKYTPVIALHNFGSKINKISDTEIIKLKDYQEPKKLSHLGFILFFLRRILPEVITLFIIVKNRRINIIHVNNNIIWGISAIIAAKISGIPCVCHIRETRYLTNKEKLFFRWVSKFIVINKVMHERYNEEIRKLNINIIYNGVDIVYDGTILSRLEQIRDRFVLGHSPVLGTIGRVVEGKGQREFVLAAKDIIAVKPEVKFLVVGDAKGGSDEYFKEVKKIAETENLRKNIIFTGWIDDLNNVIFSLDIFVFTSTTYAEGLPNSIIEAMALSKPVVATNIAGPSDIVVDGKTGFLVPPGDIKAMADKITYLLEYPAIARKMGEEGRRRAEELFDIKKQIKKIEAIYEEVLADKL